MENKIKVTKQMLEEKGSRILAKGITTDNDIGYYGWGQHDKELKFVVAKGFIDDWCIYVESMDNTQSYEQVEMYGNKVTPSIAKELIDCNEVIGRYRL